MAITLVPEDGTGLATANVYDLAAVFETYLVDRGLTVFAAGATPAIKDRWALQATEVMERESVNRVNGSQINAFDQAMLFPRFNSVNRRFQRHESDERPDEYREGIFLLAEDVAVADPVGLELVDAGIEEESGPAGSIEYRAGERTLSQRYPAAFSRASEAFPAGIRAFRA